MKRRMKHLFREDGRSLIVAMDHAGVFREPIDNLMDPGQTIRELVAGGADAIMTTFGTASRFSDDLGGCGLILSIQGSATEDSSAVVEASLQIGADGVKVLVCPWMDSEPDSVAIAYRLGTECQKWQMPFLAETLPGGFRGGPDLRTPERIAAAARIGAECGGDFIKTFYTGNPDTFRRVAENCYVPVLILGGAKVDCDQDLLEMVKGSVDAGGKGVCIGRNIWGHPHPRRMVSAIASIIHDAATVEQALMKLRGGA